MNYLLNLYLSKELGERSVGFIIGDILRNKNLPTYSAETIDGIELHKSIVQFIKKHPAYLRSKDRLPAKYNKHAFKIVSIFYDHFLASNWEKYSYEELNRFIGNAHNFVHHNFHIFPYKTKKLYSLLISKNILLNYDSIEGIHAYMQLITHKDTFQANLEHSLETLILHYELFKKDFEELIPELIGYTEKESILITSKAC